MKTEMEDTTQIPLQLSHHLGLEGTYIGFLSYRISFHSITASHETDQNLINCTSICSASIIKSAWGHDYYNPWRQCDDKNFLLQVETCHEASMIFHHLVKLKDGSRAAIRKRCWFCSQSLPKRRCSASNFASLFSHWRTAFKTRCCATSLRGQGASRKRPTLKTSWRRNA